MQEDASAQHVLFQNLYTCCAFFQDVSPESLRAPLSPHLRQQPRLLFLQSTCHGLTFQKVKMNPFGLNEVMVCVSTSKGLVSGHRPSVQSVPLGLFFLSPKQRTTRS